MDDLIETIDEDAKAKALLAKQEFEKYIYFALEPLKA